jgi:hypothetical protein
VKGEVSVGEGGLESAGRAGTGVDRRRSQGKGAESRPGLQFSLSLLFLFLFLCFCLF